MLVVLVFNVKPENVCTFQNFLVFCIQNSKKNLCYLSGFML